MPYDPDIQGPIDSTSVDLRRVLAVLANRKIEGLRLYRPMPFQQEFHSSQVAERIIRGSNRAGKSLAAAVETARFLTGQDPFGRYPVENAIGYIVGKQGREISQVLFPLLFKPGAFRMIRDEVTGDWRTFSPQSPQDIARAKEARPAPALVPRRMIKHVAWLDKKNGLPNSVTLTNGTVAHFYSSEAKPTHGSAIDFAWFDEEILDREWYTEVAARLVDRQGKFIWSATPQAGTERLFALYERAMEQVEKNVQPRTIEHFFCSIDENIYQTQEAKDQFTGKLVDDEEQYRVRVKGEFAILSGRVFPEYSPKMHEINPFSIPDSWTRYYAVDPGVQTLAVLFMAIPPPEHGDFVYLYDEIYYKGATAAIFGEQMAKHIGVQTMRAGLIDMHGARVRDMGYGKKVVEQYSDALRINKIKTVITGHEFIAGNDNIRDGVEMIRHWLRWRSDGTSKIRIFRNLWNLIKEIKHWRNQYDKVKKEFVDKPENKRDHLMSCLRYLCQYNPQWVAPKDHEKPMSGAYRYFLRKKKEEEKGRVGIHLGPKD